MKCNDRLENEGDISLLPKKSTPACKVAAPRKPLSFRSKATHHCRTRCSASSVSALFQVPRFLSSLLPKQSQSFATKEKVVSTVSVAFNFPPIPSVFEPPGIKKSRTKSFAIHPPTSLIQPLHLPASAATRVALPCGGDLWIPLAVTAAAASDPAWHGAGGSERADPHQRSIPHPRRSPLVHETGWGSSSPRRSCCTSR